MAASIDVLDPSWINAPGGVGPSYDAEELRRLQGYQLAAGATPGSTRTGVLNPRDLALSLSGSNVLVGPGGCAIGTAKGAYVAGVAATTTIGALVAADVTNPRRDRVVLEILDPDNGGGAGRKAQLRIIDGTPNASAATGGGFPAAPTSPFIDLGYADMPKVGAGSPSLTITAPITAMAGAPIPVRSQTERDALPKWVGLQVCRLDLSGAIDRYTGSRWVPADEVITATTTDNNWNYAVRLASQASADGTQTVVTMSFYISRKTGAPAMSITTATTQLLTTLIPAGWRPALATPGAGVVSGNSYGSVMVTPQPGGTIDVRSTGGTIPITVNSIVAATICWIL